MDGTVHMMFGMWIIYGSRDPGLGGLGVELHGEQKSKKSIFCSFSDCHQGVPAYPTATCGMDVLTHALEAFTSARQNPYSDAIAIGHSSFCVPGPLNQTCKYMFLLNLLVLPLVISSLYSW